MVCSEMISATIDDQVKYYSFMMPELWWKIIRDNLGQNKNDNGKNQLSSPINKK